MKVSFLMSFEGQKILLSGGKLGQKFFVAGEV
jgi:hypothetical protein